MLGPLVSEHQAEARQPQQRLDKDVVALLVKKADFAFQVIFVGRAQCHGLKLFHLPFCLVLSRTQSVSLGFLLTLLTQVEAQLVSVYYLSLNW